ncbi:hypothetical protein WN51_09159 [Melipona quadrifasciata]|uniref:Uncharacterized protein n=1 Tax=Melipona quadrifasciata TaxID=166423 RepID=A0A0M8ZPN7_9HYME|nr:hypothetical protein WN51_09159 [Melipona quadrifasciata]
MHKTKEEHVLQIHIKVLHKTSFKLTDENIITVGRTVKSPICYRCHGHAALEDTVIIHGERHASRVSTVTPTPYRRPGMVDEWKRALQLLDGSWINGLEELVVGECDIKGGRKGRKRERDDGKCVMALTEGRTDLDIEYSEVPIGKKLTTDSTVNIQLENDYQTSASSTGQHGYDQSNSAAVQGLTRSIWQSATQKWVGYSPIKRARSSNIVWFDDGTKAVHEINVIHRQTMFHESSVHDWRLFRIDTSNVNGDLESVVYVVLECAGDHRKSVQMM